MTALPGPTEAVWNDLALAADNVFATRTWCECWWQHFGQGEPLVLGDRGADSTMLVPIFVSGRLLRRVQLVGTGPADALTPACRPEDRTAAWHLLRQHLATRRDWDVAVVHDVTASEEPLAGVRGDVVEVRRSPSPVLDIETDDWEAFVVSRSRSFRENAGRKRRKLERESETSFRLATAETLEDDLDTFFRLHLARWGDDTPLVDETMQAFQRDFARRALARDWLRLWTVELDGVAVATSWCLRFGAAEYYYQGGRDPAYDDRSVGAVLMARTIQHAVETGATQYRLLRGDESYKSRWAGRGHDVRTLAVARTVRGAAAVKLAVRRADRGAG